MATDEVNDARTPCELYQLLGSSADATKEEIISAYKDKVLTYEKTLHTTKDKRLLSAARQSFTEVSKAFYILSDNDRRGIYDRSNVIVEPTKRDKKTAPNNEYFVQHNKGSVTIYIPTGTVKDWVDIIEAHYNMPTEYKEGNGHQLIGVPFRTPDTDEVVGFVTLHVYHTGKILVQGSAFYLWTMYMFDHLKQQLSASLDTEVRCEDTVCNKCQHPGPEDDGVIQCDTCHKWYHYVCTGLQQNQLQELITNEDREYNCYACRADVPIHGTTDTDLQCQGVPQYHETTPKELYSVSSSSREDENNNEKLSSLQNSVDKLESILISRVTTDKEKIDTLSSRISHMEMLLSKTKDAPAEKMAKASDIEALKRRVNALEAENKNLRNKVMLLEQKTTQNENRTMSRTDTFPKTGPSTSAREPGPTDNTATVVPTVPTRNKFEVLLTDTTGTEQIANEPDTNRGGSVPGVVQLYAGQGRMAKWPGGRTPHTVSSNSNMTQQKWRHGRTPAGGCCAAAALRWLLYSASLINHIRYISSRTCQTPVTSTRTYTSSLR
uniref:PHD-type domain-containing protein n=1 Tax=Branchiostoma floridae TaxID=7739 RepID=C3YGM6_BRAFL|eukprot:XP_002604525.1 hypothetical protein BRAFLDRAFT_122321 [Branchiostoma floridae]